MKTVLGITAEYDPFHKGHAWQLARAAEQVRPEAVVCVMSGDFTQRGEPAVLDKWSRARIAAEQGVDLVFELPFMYACSRARRFAAGAVDLLAASGVTHISFGCEAEHPEELVALAEDQLAAAQPLEEMTGQYMKDGYSHVKAAELASRTLFGDERTRLLLAPNNILALEYLKRIRQREETCGQRIRPVPIRRHGSGYASADPDSGFAGGTAIRQLIETGGDCASYLPYEPDGLPWIDQAGARRRLYEHVRSMLLRSTPEQLRRICCVGEGMEHRLLREARQQESYEGFLSAMVSKRYTAAAIRRIMIYILMNIEEMPVCGPYGRVLAAREAGRSLLRRLEDLPLIANSNRLAGVAEPVRQSLALDARAADMYHLLCGRPVDLHGDGRQRPFIV